MTERILIVGGSSGIGLCLAKKLSENGARVVIASRSMEKIAGAEKTLGGNHEYFALDASDENEVLAFSERLGTIDHLAVTIRGPAVSSAFKNSSTEEVKNAFEGKFWASYFIVRHCLKNIRNGGSITLSSGITSQRSYPCNYWQSFTNSALESLVKSTAAEILPVRINAVSPGFVERNENDTERFEMVKELEPRLPMKRLATGNEIADAYIFLMRSSYSTGTVLCVDGGLLLV